MITRRPSRVHRDSGDPSSLPARTGNASWLLTEWSWRSLVQRQEVTPPCPVIDLMLSLPSVVPSPLPSLSSTTAISLPPVFTSLTHSPSSSDKPNPTSPSIPLETTAVSSSNTSPPESTSFWSDPPLGSVVPTLEIPISGHHAESGTETTSTSFQFTLLPTPTPMTFIDDFPILPSKMTSTNTELGTTDGGVNAVTGLNSTPTNKGGVVPDTMRPEAPIAGRNRMIGAIVGSAVIVCLLLSGIIFCLRRRMSMKLSHRNADTARTVPSVVSHSVSPHATMGQQESGMIAYGQNPFPDCSGGPIRDSTTTAASVHRQCSQLGRDSQISASSWDSRSMRFTASGSYHNSANSYSSRATMSIITVDAAHSVALDPSADLAPPRTPVSFNTNTDYSASWRGTNLSNIINATRGIKA